MKYRAEIDGLRALAVIPVILFHAGLDLFSGGYAGVDIFFVISGYLITSIIIEDIENGTFSIAKFYERRVRRILPALLVVLLACIPFSYLWMTPDQFESFSHSLVAVVLFVSNLLFMSETGYFDDLSDDKPLLHTWSLAVEEQYYLLYPLFLLLLFPLGKKKLGLIILVSIIVSLTTAEWVSRIAPDINFFLTSSRAWELLLGACIVLFIKKDYQFSVTTRNNASLAGIVLIIISLVLLDRSTPFPGIYALFPTVGTVLIIIYANQTTLVGRLLSIKPVAFVGLISYSAYLWHQPLFAFARLHSLHQPEAWLLVILALLTFPIAYLSWRFIEKPFRNRHGIAITPLVISIASISFVLFLTGVIGSTNGGFTNRINNYDIASAVYGGKGFDWGENTFNGEILDNTGGKKGAILYGDSHAIQYIDALIAMSNRHHFTVATKVHSACMTMPDATNIYKGKLQKSCIRMLDKLEMASSGNNKTIILAFSWLKQLVDHNGQEINGVTNYKDSAVYYEYLINELNAFIQRYGENRRYIIIGNVPTALLPKKGFLWCALFKDLPEDCHTKFDISKGTGFGFRKYLEEFSAQRKNVFLIDPYKALCRGGECYVAQGNKIIYSDHGHLSKYGAERVLQMFENDLVRLIKSDDKNT